MCLFKRLVFSNSAKRMSDSSFSHKLAVEKHRSRAAFLFPWNFPSRLGTLSKGLRAGGQLPDKRSQIPCRKPPIQLVAHLPIPKSVLECIGTFTRSCQYFSHVVVRVWASLFERETDDELVTGHVWCFAARSMAAPPPNRCWLVAALDLPENCPMPLWSKHFCLDAFSVLCRFFCKSLDP